MKLRHWLLSAAVGVSVVLAASSYSPAGEYIAAMRGGELKGRDGGRGYG